MSYVLCSSDELGFPVRAVSRSFSDFYGFSSEELAGRPCKAAIGLEAIKAHDPELAGLASLSGLRRETVELALDALDRLVRQEVKQMACGVPSCALLVNRRRNGELVTIALVLKQCRQIASAHSYCVGIQFHITDSLSVKELLTAALCGQLVDLRDRYAKRLIPRVANLDIDDLGHLLEDQAVEASWDSTSSAFRSSSSLGSYPGTGSLGSPKTQSPDRTPFRETKTSPSVSKLSLQMHLAVNSLQKANLPIQWPQDEAPSNTPRSDASAASTSSLLSRRSGRLRQLSVGAPQAEVGVRQLLHDKGYVLGGMLGRGFNRGFSVHAASHRGQNFAVKYTDEAKSEGVLVSVLKKEYQILRRLQHPHIVNVFHFLGGELGAAMVMEHCSGMKLDTVMRLEGRLSLALRRMVGHQVLSAVAHLHTRGIAHRDLHAENVMVDVRSQPHAGQEPVSVKLLDFGSAEELGPPGPPGPPGTAAEPSSQNGQNGAGQGRAGQGAGGVDEREDVNVRILPPRGAEGPPFARDVFAVGLLLLGLMLGRAAFVEDVVGKDGNLQLPSTTGVLVLTSSACTYLCSLLCLHPDGRPTAEAAHTTLPGPCAWMAARHLPDSARDLHATNELACEEPLLERKRVIVSL